MNFDVSYTHIAKLDSLPVTRTIKICADDSWQAVFQAGTRLRDLWGSEESFILRTVIHYPDSHTIYHKYDTDASERALATLPSSANGKGPEHG